MSSPTPLKSQTRAVSPITPKNTTTLELDDLLMFFVQQRLCFCVSLPLAGFSESSSEKSRFLWQGVNYIDNLALVGVRSTTRYNARWLLCAVDQIAH